MDYTNSYIGNLLNAISQLGNAIAGGVSDISISARVGYMVFVKKTKLKYWQMIRVIIDFTFYPLDGNDHCLNAYKNDPDENFKVQKGPWWSLGIIAFFVCIVCSLLMPFFYAFNLISKKRLK